MAVWTEKVFGTPREQAVGSTTTAKYGQREGFPEITKTTDYLFVPDQDGKPAGLHQYIGRRPVLCVGNSDGDQAMMDYTAISNPVPASWVLFHHTGGEREYRYDTEPPLTGRLTSAMQAAGPNGWTVVDMKMDWNAVFAD